MRQVIQNCEHISMDMSGVEENLANGISVENVADCLQSNTTGTLLLDCRPFIAFNDNHVLDALNVYCPPILKRRSNGFVSLENIVTCERKRKLLQEGQYKSVIVYDADTTDLAHSAKDSNLYPVLKSLRQQVDIEQVNFIIGGFNAFKASNPQLCVGQNGNPPAVTLAPPPKYTSCKGGPVEILPGLYLGDSLHSAQQDTLRELGITCLLNVSTTCKNMFEQDFDYMNIPVNDNDSANISSWFNEAIHFIDNARDNEGKVLVHCHAGVSRSATVCIAYIMYKNTMQLEEAFDHVRSKRGVISPNLNFMQQLKEFEKDLFGSGAKTYDIPDSVSSISNSLASVDFDLSCSSTSASDFSASSGAFDFTFASPAVPPLSPRELVSPS
ncbi:dual specificity protein phosphatase 1-like [Mercenaria mercenaria]|uniref:dual specificity protein phosphatase 1-like n=1 Tax=Mercenaria mercenaria TaxID=6596 RepID=UPI001E1D9DDD|nr:dual specificity protein phosphatase 1-like [Mercenaria mercenaria]